MCTASLYKFTVDLFTLASSPDASIISVIQTTAKAEILIYGTVVARIKPARRCAKRAAMHQLMRRDNLILQDTADFFLNNWRIWENKT